MTEPTADRAHWGASVLMLLAVLIPVGYWYAKYGSQPAKQEELLPPPKEEELLPPPKEGIALTPQEQQLLQLINEARAQDVKKPAPLLPHPTLFEVARAHAGNMAKQRNQSDELDGKGTPARVREAGYPVMEGRLEVHYLFGTGVITPDVIFRDWMGSPATQEQLLSGDFVDTGIGMAPDNMGEMYCCLILAAPRK